MTLAFYSLGDQMIMAILQMMFYIGCLVLVCMALVAAAFIAKFLFGVAEAIRRVLQR